MKLNKQDFKQIRLNAGITQSRLAEYFGLSSQTRISEYENGKRYPGAGILKLYDLLNKGKLKIN